MPNKPSSTSRRSWRKATARPGSSSAARWVFTLLGIALLVVFGWVLWGRSSRVFRTHFLAIISGEAHRLSAPPMPFGREDVSAIEQAAAEESSLAFYDLSLLQEADKIEGLAAWLANLDAPAKDVVILYVSAHGISDGETPYLLCRDYDVESPREARYPVARLLDQLQSCPAQTKLLVLDAGRIISDPLLGMLVNEFPRLLADEVSRHDGEGLWVLASHSVGETTAASYAENRTVFGQCVSAGLLGEANDKRHGGNGDRYVSLDELVGFVSSRCRQLTGENQTPLLFHSGHGLSSLEDVPGDVRLAWVDSNRPDQQESDGEQSAGRATSSADAPTATAARSEPPKPKDAHGDETVRAAGSAPAPVRTLATALRDAWMLRDRLEQLPLASNGLWSPTEFAPHLWREFNAWLLDVDLASRAGHAFAAERLLEPLERQLEKLQVLALEPGSVPSPGTQSSLVADQLAASAYEFHQSPARETFQQTTPELRAVGDAVRQYYRCLYQMADYVRWFTRISLVWPDFRELDIQARSTESLAQKLREFQDSLQSRSGSRLADTPGVDPLVAQARGLAEELDQLNGLLEHQVAALADSAQGLENRSRIETLLSLALLSAEQRQILVDKLYVADALSNAEGIAYAVEDRPPRLTLGPARRRRLIQALSLYQQQLELAGVPQHGEFVRALGELDKLMASGADETDEMWQHLRQLGAKARDAYLSLPALLARPGDDAEQRPRLFRLADGRQAIGRARGISPRLAFPQLPILPSPTIQPLEVVQLPGGPLRLGTADQDARTGDAAEVDLRIRSGQPGLARISVTFDYDEQRLALHSANGKKVAPATPVAVPLSPAGEANVSLRIRALTGVESDQSGPLPVVATINAGSRTERWTISCTIAKPDRIDLVIDRILPAERARQYGRDGTELHVFPNRTTHFRISAINLSDHVKDVNVALYAVPRTAWVAGRLVNEVGDVFPDVANLLFESDTLRVLPGIEPVAVTSQPLHLLPDAQPHEIDFSPQARQDAGQAVAEENGGVGKPAESQPIAITHGLVCLISDVQNNRDRWVKWIEIHPVLPSEYVNVDVRYTGQEAVAEVRPISDRMPSLSGGPIEVLWDTRGEIPAGTQGNDRAAIRRGDEVAQLRMALEPHRTQTAAVRLNVDGYPRAFVYQIRRSGPNAGQDLRPDARHVRIESVALEDREFRALPPRGDTADTEPDKKQQVFDLQREGFAAFPRPARDLPLTVALQVDAPANAFSVRDRRDVLEVGFAREYGQPMRFYSDRQMQAWIEEVSSGSIAVGTRITDHSILLDMGGLRGRGQLAARLTVSQGEVRQDSVQVVIDEEPPATARASVPREVRQGEPLAVYLEVVDLSGPQTVVAGLVANRDDQLNKDASVTKTDFVQPAGLSWPVSLQLGTANVKPGDYFVKAQVTDRVGKQTTSQLGSIRVLPPPVAPKKDAASAGPPRGTLNGVVRFGRAPAFAIQVTLKDRGKSTETDTQGRFSFPDLDAGSYTLEARGSAKGLERSGSRTVELKSARDFAETWVVQIE